jgi:hypothetical protein
MTRRCLQCQERLPDLNRTGLCTRCNKSRLNRRYKEQAQFVCSNCGQRNGYTKRLCAACSAHLSRYGEHRPPARWSDGITTDPDPDPEPLPDADCYCGQPATVKRVIYIGKRPEPYNLCPACDAEEQATAQILEIVLK